MALTGKEIVVEKFAESPSLALRDTVGDMAAGTLVSVEEYLRTNYEPNAEYIDGELRPKALGTWKHARIQARLVMLLGRFRYVVGTELTVRLSPTRYLIPDIAASERADASYPEEPVLLCVEILSPGDRIGAMLAKCEEYHAWGVPHCWVVDPEDRVAWEYERGARPVECAGEAALHAGEIEIRVSEIFSVLA